MRTTTSTADRLRAMLDRPGPYLTVVLDTEGTTADQAWRETRDRACELGAPEALLSAVDGAVEDVESDPGEMAAWAAIASSDGAVEVFTSLEPPRSPVCELAAVPCLAPLIEWDQRAVPHIVVVASEDRFELIPFASGHEPTPIWVSVDFVTADRRLRTLVDKIDARLIAVGGDEERARAAARHFRAHLPPLALVTVLPDDETASVDDFADAVVRHVSTVHANDTVAALKEFRFERSHGATAEGPTEVLRAMRTSEVRTILVHDDPDDGRVVAMGRPDDLESIGEAGPTAEDTESVRLVDAVVAVALQRGVDVHIIPSTGPTGPEEDLGVIVDPTPIEE